MAVARLAFDAVGWPKLADLAAHASGRPAIVQARAADYVPTFGELSSRQSKRLLGSVEDMLARGNGSFLLPLHSTEAFYAPSMLTEGFGWARWRDPVNGFEPYEDKLREWQALGDGERSEDFLFTAVADPGNQGSLAQSLAKQSRMLRNVGRSSSTGYGNTTFAFDPRTLANATVVSGVSVLGLYGTSAGTIEHLPGLIASRLAADAGNMWSVEERGLAGLEAAGHKDFADWRRATVAQSRADLDAALEVGDHQGRMMAITMEYFRSVIHSGNPIEAHVRRLTPADIVRVDVEPATVHLLDREGVPTRGPGMRQERLHVEPGMRTVVAGLVDPHRLELIAEAAHRSRVPVAGVPQQRAAWAAAVDLRDRFGPESVTVKVEPDRPSTPTAQTTSKLRQAMAAARAKAAAADSQNLT